MADLDVNGKPDSDSIGGGLLSAIVDIIFPIGAIYTTTSSTFDPNTTFGGTWTKITNKFLVGAGDAYKVTATGGNSTSSVTLSESNLPSHSHTFTGTAASHTHTFSGTAASHTHSIPSHTHSIPSHTHSFYADYYVRHGNGSARNLFATGTNTTVNDGAYSETWSNGIDLASYSHNPDQFIISGNTGSYSGTSGSYSGTSGSSSVTPAGTNASTSITPSGTISSTGSGSAFTFDILPPYEAVYMWERTK